MPNWQGSDRSTRLPPNWSAIRLRILKRDGYRCKATDTYDARCSEPATEVDHINRGDDHRDENLRALCDWHHDKKSGAEGAAQKAANWRRNNQKFRRVERHPGLQ